MEYLEQKLGEDYIVLMEQYMKRFPEQNHLRKVYRLENLLSKAMFSRLLEMALEEGDPLPVDERILGGT